MSSTIDGPEVDYRLAYKGACAHLDALTEKYNQLLAAAIKVFDTDNKYEFSEALDGLRALVAKDR